MAVIAKQTVLKGLTVKDAMRRQVLHLPRSSAIDTAINRLIKYKTSALLALDDDSMPVGVVSKTDIMGAYYASLPLDSPLEGIMTSPPLFCNEADSLESALDMMRSKGVYRLYVYDETPDDLSGVLAYPDIVGLLYQYCHRCERSTAGRRREKAAKDEVPRFTVKEVMTPSVMSFGVDDSLLTIMEGLSAYRFGAVLITDEAGLPRGVVSKTDLILAYKHRITPEAHAGTIMSSPVLSRDSGDFIEDAVREMIFSEVHRLFVYHGSPENIAGVFSLSDAARLRSGSCRACMTSRIRLTEHT